MRETRRTGPEAVETHSEGVRQMRFISISGRGVTLSISMVAGLGLFPPLLSAQAGASDAGEFEVMVNGSRAGTEEFSIQQTGTGENIEIIATGRVRLSLPSGTIELAPRLRASGFLADPVAYEVTVGGTSPRRIVGQIAGGRFSARITSPAGEQMREYVASSGATILDDAVAHHYYFLVQRVRHGTIPILVPRENRQVMAAVEDMGQEMVEIRGARLPLHHIVVRPSGGDERHAWVDSRDRVIRVEIPAQGYLATRTVIPR